MKETLTKKELNEPMYMTWGRIKRRVMYYSKDKRLQALVLKMEIDMKFAKIEEKHFPLKVKTN